MTKAPASTRGRPRVALVGPDPAAHGGVAGFIHALLGSGLGERFELVPVATHRDGTRVTKLKQAARGLSLLSRLCSSGEVDLVHVNSSWGASFPRKALAVAIARRSGLPVVLHLHGSGFQRAFRRRGLRGVLARRSVGYVARAADAVIAATPAWGAEVTDRTGVAVRVIPNTPDIAVSGDGRDAPGRPTVLFLGRLERAKGVFELVEAAAALQRTRPRLRVVLAGRGRDEAQLRRLIAQKGLDGVVERPGWVDCEAKRKLLAEASCLVLPSYAEGLPLAMLEAMLSGVPVVATRVGGIPDAVRHGHEALLVPPRDVGALADAIGRELDDELLATRLAGAARVRALAEFGPERVAAALSVVYAELVGEEPALSGAARPQRGLGYTRAGATARVGSTMSSSHRSAE